ncbi:hypothetical protein AAFF_G00064980 [Aldrovandia affinis]|uniref:EGF-like domain-containing protein n=1 Tax=Aldrovandia affinis TaxID=143900 RepID=A0AAD7T3T2_9TELE|nr:hypothetical protein AAFF_G00064980 [Aldrovandia affinis]
MNCLLLVCFLSLACCCLETLGGGVTRTSIPEERNSVTSSGSNIQSSTDEDEELGHEEDVELPQVQRLVKPDGKSRRRGKGKRKHKNKGSPSDTPSDTPTHSPTSTTAQVQGEDPCSSTHQDYCIHGYCKYMADLREATCVCMMGYDGERCGIQLLKTELKESDSEVVQTVLVVIAVVLSLISCCAILLMICAHYRIHRNFLAAYLGNNSEKEKLQTNGSDIVV